MKNSIQVSRPVCPLNKKIGSPFMTQRSPNKLFLKVLVLVVRLFEITFKIYVWILGPLKSFHWKIQISSFEKFLKKIQVFRSVGPLNKKNRLHLQLMVLLIFWKIPWRNPNIFRTSFYDSEVPRQITFKSPHFWLWSPLKLPLGIHVCVLRTLKNVVK